MMLKVFFFITLLSFNLQAADMGITVNANNDLVLTDTKCDNLLKQEAALCSWKKKAEPDFIIPKTLQTKCLPAGSGKVKLVITKCLPEFAKTYQSKKLVHDGPNCWGTAMSFNKLSPRPRFMWPEEMQYWMTNSPLCKKLAVGERPLPGDIINVYAPEKMDKKERLERDAGTRFWEALYPNRYTQLPYDENGSDYTGYHRLLHSVTYVSDGLAFGKDSPSKLDRFYFHPMSEVYGRPRESECQENQTLDPYMREYNRPPKKIKGSTCSYFSLAYRCEDFAAYFSKLKLNDADKTTWQSVQSLQGLQAKLFPLLTSNNKILQDCEITLITALVDITVKRASEELKTPNLDKNREMLLTMEYFAAAGIRQTLEQVELIKPLRSN